MNNPFKNLSSGEKDKDKKFLQQQIESEAWSITKKVMFRKLKASDINRLERLYKDYFQKYPDVKKELDANKRIGQLRGLIK